jgi:MFS transporter, DHA1 family, multidrug resistance protein
MYCGPAIGPLMAGYAVSSDWRWPLYEIIIMAVIVMALLPFMPETYPDTVLLHRARRLRKATGNDAYRAESELKPLELGKILFGAFIRPIQITVLDPAVAYAFVPRSCLCRPD